MIFYGYNDTKNGEFRLKSPISHGIDLLGGFLEFSLKIIYIVGRMFPVGRLKGGEDTLAVPIHEVESHGCSDLNPIVLL
jgi:hypothetical protein